MVPSLFNYLEIVKSTMLIESCILSLNRVPSLSTMFTMFLIFKAVVVAQAVEWWHREPTIQVSFSWALGFFLCLSISGASLFMSLFEVQCLLTFQKIVRKEQKLFLKFFSNINWNIMWKTSWSIFIHRTNRRWRDRIGSTAEWKSNLRLF